MYARSISKGLGKGARTALSRAEKGATTARQPHVCNIATHHAGSYAAHVFLTLSQYKPILYGWLLPPSPAASAARPAPSPPFQRQEDADGRRKKSTRRFFLGWLRNRHFFAKEKRQKKKGGARKPRRGEEESHRQAINKTDRSSPLSFCLVF